jgi:hypothetical protein
MMFTTNQKEIIDQALSTLIWETKKNILDTQNSGEYDSAVKNFLVEQRKLLEEATLLRKELREDNLWNPVR